MKITVISGQKQRIYYFYISKYINYNVSYILHQGYLPDTYILELKYGKMGGCYNHHGNM